MAMAQLELQAALSVCTIRISLYFCGHCRYPVIPCGGSIKNMVVFLWLGSENRLRAANSTERRRFGDAKWVQIRAGGKATKMTKNGSFTP
jgi:hypothetical protein